MLNPVPQCTHIKTNGDVCGSPAVSGTVFCHHHSAVKTALAKVPPAGKSPNGAFAPIPFVFPEDRASMQINFFLLLEAFNEQRIDLRTYRSMLSMLKAMSRNLGKSGSLIDNTPENCDQPSTARRPRQSGKHDQEETSRLAVRNAQQRPADPLTDEVNEALQEFFRTERAANPRAACLA